MTVAIRGAREHNLRSVDLDLPRDQLIVFCGVSGSGKSSLAFDTLFVEGQRRYLEALALGRGKGATLVPPRVDAIDGLPPTLALHQRPGTFGRGTTVGSVAGVSAVLRVLFARAGVAHCPACDRPVVVSTHDEIVAALQRLPEGTRLTLEAPVAAPSPAVVEEVQRAGFSRLRVGDDVVRIDELDPRRVRPDVTVRIVVDRIRVGPDRSSRIDDSVRLCARAGRGVVVAVHDGGVTTFVDRPVCVHDGTVLPPLEPASLSPRTPAGACPTCEGSGVDGADPCGACGGTRLSAAARAVRWRDRTLPSVLATPIHELTETLATLGPGDAGIAAVEAVALPDLRRRLGRLTALHLGELHLGDPIDGLSGSQLQRVRLARQVATGLSGMLVVLDEPVAGLRPELVEIVVGVLRELVAAGNTVIAVEHTPAVIRAADHAVEFGAGAGRDGGRVVYQGDVAGLVAADTATGRWLSGRAQISPRQRVPAGKVSVSGRWRKGRDAPEVALGRGGVLVAITGPAASGKSALVSVLGASLAATPPEGVHLIGAEGLSRPILAERAAARSARSSPATYIGLWDVVRELLASTRDAAVRGLGVSAFSLAAPGGRCEACKGTGERIVELGPLPDVVQVCPVCEGRRFQRDVLEVRWRGLDASELLALSAAEAHPLLSGHPRLDEGLRALVRVGLGYVPLGQSVGTLSGGEARLLALARELARASRRGSEDAVVILDDPTVGLHPADTARLVDLLRELCDGGATAWLASVDPLVLGAADRTVDLG